MHMFFLKDISLDIYFYKALSSSDELYSNSHTSIKAFDSHMQAGFKCVYSMDEAVKCWLNKSKDICTKNSLSTGFLE